MGRNAEVTYEQVQTAAEAIRTRGLTPGPKAIRAEIGVGSFTTIGKLLDQWEREQEERHTMQRLVPPALQNAIFAFADQAVGESHERLLADLAEYKQRIADLFDENKRRDDIALHQDNQIAQLNSENAMQAGMQAQLRTDLRKIDEKLRLTRQSAERARTELAVAQVRLHSFELVESKLRKARSEVVAQRQARTLAEQEAALLAATKVDLEHRLAGAGDALVRMEHSMKDVANKLNEERERRIAAELELAVLTAGHSQTVHSPNQL